jgi:hypothetical protein
MSDVPGGPWWRFDSYEIREGWLRPVSNAALEEFDPWTAYWKTPSEDRVSEPPYVAFVNMITALPTPGENNDAVQLAADEEAALLDWCGQYGLLGLLTHMFLYVSVGRMSMLRSCDPWFPTEEPEDPTSPRSKTSSHAIVEPIWGGEPERQTLNKVWAPCFFPDVPKDDWETFDYPAPLTPKFWDQYGERVIDFIKAGRRFADAVTRLADTEGGDFPDSCIGSIEGAPLVTEGSARATLNGLMKSTKPVQILDDEGYEQRIWRSPSFLGMLAMMHSQDLIGDRRLFRCACGGVFASTYPGTKYCSPKHRDRYRKRELRERQKRKQRKKASSRGRRAGGKSR